MSTDLPLELPVYTSGPLHRAPSVSWTILLHQHPESPCLLKHHIKDHLFPVHPFSALKDSHPGHLLPSVHSPWPYLHSPAANGLFGFSGFLLPLAQKTIKPSASSLQSGERRSLWRIPENTMGGSSSHTWQWLCLVPVLTHSHPQLLITISHGQRRVNAEELRNRVRRGMSQAW